MTFSALHGIIFIVQVRVQIRIFRGELVYNKLGKDEIIVSISLFIFALVYRILEDYQVNMIPSGLALLVLMICTAYLCFNRVVKLLINRNKNNFYCTSAVIQSTKYIPAGRGSYICYVIKYEDESRNTHIKELHNFYSIKSLKVGDEIKINIDKNNPDDITEPFSNFMIAIITCVIGIVFEFILIVMYICAH